MIICTADYEPLKGITAPVESFDRVMAVNVRSTMLCYKYAAKQMIAQGRGGRIIGARTSHLPSVPATC